MGDGFRLCAGVGNSLTKETAREGEDDRRGGGGRAEEREQQIWTEEGTAGTVEGKVCSESGECWTAHGEGVKDQTQHSSSFLQVLQLLINLFLFLCCPFSPLGGDSKWKEDNTFPETQRSLGCVGVLCRGTLCKSSITGKHSCISLKVKKNSGWHCWPNNDLIQSSKWFC